MNDISNDAVQNRIFISYARGDDEQFVKRLSDDLKKAGFPVWYDRESLMSRGLTFHHEIKDAIRTGVDRVVYVGGPQASFSAYVREEWQFALECDHVVVTPILRLGDYNQIPGELSLLHCEDFREDKKYSSSIARLIENLQQPNPKLGGLFAVPNLPSNFIGRPDLMCRVRDALLVDLQKPQVITSADARVGMQGMGGIGKSVLASALARNRQVRQSYPDGIIWISCGKNLTREDLLQRQRDLSKHLGGDSNFDSIPQGQGILRELLATKAVLLILDDVWQATDAQVFDVLGPRCRILVTTRDAGILHSLHGELVPVSLFTETEALQLLADVVEIERPVLSPEALEVVKECGYLPLAVALSAGMAKKRGGDFHSVLDRLRKADLDKIADRESINEQHRSIWRAMQASVEVLPEDEQQRFAELAVFNTDGTIPESAIATLWSHTGNLDDLDSEDLLINFTERSLIQLDKKTIVHGEEVKHRYKLHDLLHDYAVRIAGESKSLHNKLLDSYRKKCIDGWSTGPNDGYYFENLAGHLLNTGLLSNAESLVTNFQWLMRKCEIGLLNSIYIDYGLFDEPALLEIKKKLEIWLSFFREKAHILRRGNDEWPAHKILLQLAVEHADDSPLTLNAEKWLDEGRCDWLWLRRNLRLPHVQKSACLAVLEGHTSGCIGAIELSDHRILSWSVDDTLRLWNLDGVSDVVIEGHTKWVNGAIELSDGRILSWSSDKTLRIWSGSGSSIAVLKGHTDDVCGAAELRNGFILSWPKSFYGDNTVRLWNRDGVPVTTLKGHTSAVMGAVVLSNDRILSWSTDKTLRLWNDKGVLIAILDAHTEWVNGALELKDGRILSWSGDATLRLWESDGAPIAVLLGHEKPVIGAMQLDDGRILSWSGDSTLRFWSNSGIPVATLLGHTGGGLYAIELADGRILSWSEMSHDGDNRIFRVWNQDGVPATIYKGHQDTIRGTSQLKDGRILSWSNDKTLRIWDDELVITFKGHTDTIKGAVELSNRRILSWSSDGTLRLWDQGAQSNPRQCVSSLIDHRDALHNSSSIGITELSDGRVLSWEKYPSLPGCLPYSNYNTIRLLSEDGHPVATLCGHTNYIRGVQPLDDGRILSWSQDGTLRLWQDDGILLHTFGPGNGSINAMQLSDGLILGWCGCSIWMWWPDGELVTEFKGHTDWINGVLEINDGRILSWSNDGTLRIWHQGMTVLRGHTGGVTNAIELSNGRILSWCENISQDNRNDRVLRLWDNEGNLINVLKGHSQRLQGAIGLSNGRVLSWAFDDTLRLWDKDGNPLSVMNASGINIKGVCQLEDDHILTWTHDNTFHLWDMDGRHVESVPGNELAKKHPEWLPAICIHINDVVVYEPFINSIGLVKTQTKIKLSPVCWCAEFAVILRSLRLDGTIVATQANGQVCFLKLYQGNQRISLDELEEKLQGKIDKKILNNMK